MRLSFRSPPKEDPALAFAFLCKCAFGASAEMVCTVGVVAVLELGMFVRPVSGRVWCNPSRLSTRL